MADIIANMPINADPVLKKKRGKNRKPLQPKNPSTNEANILAGKLSSPLSDLRDVASGKENFSSKKTNPASNIKNSFEKELQEVQEKLEQMRIEKEMAEELLKTRDELLKQKDEELEMHGKEEEKLRKEIKKLQKLKEFKPTVSFPIVQSEKEQEKEGKKKKKKKKKGEKVKKPCAAYILWCRDQWNEVKKENPNAEFKEIPNILGAKWKNLSEEEKKPYEEKYQEDKEAYLEIVGKEKREKEAMKLLEEEQKQKTANELLEQYLQFKQEADEEKEIQKNGKKKKAKKERDPSKPKHYLSAFFLYMKDRRPALVEEKKNVSEIAKIAGEEWKSMGEEQRKPYEEIARNKKEEYQKEMELYKQKKEDEAETRRLEEEELAKIQKQEALQLLKKKEKTDDIIKKTKEKKQKKKMMKEEKETDPNKPKRPPSSFLLFRQETRKNLQQEKPDISNSTINTLVTIKWKELSEEEKDVWNTKAVNAMNAYKMEMQEYNNGSTSMAENNHQELKSKDKKEKKNKQKEKRKSDPNKPKRPPSSFLLFSQEMRKKLQQEKPEANNATIIALITVKWKELSEAEKDMWNTKALNAMNAYKKEMEEYNNGSMTTVESNQQTNAE